MSGSKQLVVFALFAAATGHACAGGKAVRGVFFQPNPAPRVQCQFGPFHLWHDADPFFKGLKEVKNRGAVHYRRGHDEVVNFPDSTVISVSFWPQGPLRGDCPSGAAFDPETVRFRVEWQDADRRSPAAGTFVVSKNSSRPLWCEENCAVAWTYELRIDSRNVPLLNKLVVSIETSEGARLAEYVGTVSTEDVNLPLPPPWIPASEKPLVSQR